MELSSELQRAQQEAEEFSRASGRLVNGREAFELNHLNFRVLSYHRSFQLAHYCTGEHEHPNYEISFMRAGSMVTGGERRHIAASADANRIFFAPPLTFHTRTFGPEPYNVNDTIMLMISGADEYGRRLAQILPDAIRAKGCSFAYSPALADLSRMFGESAVRGECARETVMALLKAWMAVFFLDNFPEFFDAAQLRKCLERNEPEFIRDRVGAIKNAVENCFVVNHPLKVCESRLGLSLRHLNRIFKAETGMTLNQYLVRRRLEAAENMLRMSRAAIGEIASVLGFSSPEQFAVFFRRFHDCTPSEFRNRE